MMRNIAIIAGGDQSEIVVSMKSAAGVRSFIDSSKYNSYIAILESGNWRVEMPDGSIIPIDKNDFSITVNNQKITFDCAYNTIHGMPGEDGQLQGYFDMIKMPYTSSGLLASAITFNKFCCNTYLKSFGIKVAESMLVRKGKAVTAEEVVKLVGLPCFIKPNAGGSSFGVTKVTKQNQVLEAIEKAFTESNEVIIESLINGTEVTNGLYKTLSNETILPITEVIPKNDFFDFEAKYTSGMAEEITPARISDALTSRIQKLSSAIYDILGCKGIVRIDYIIDNNVVYLLEVNTTPGMTITSFIPQQIKAAKLPIGDVFTEIIEDSINRMAK